VEGLFEAFWPVVFGRWLGRPERSPEVQQSRLIELLDRAAAEPEYMQQLVAQPLPTARAAGLDLGFLRAALRMPGASEASLGQALVEQAKAPRAPNPTLGELS
jgi:hypothetical protein